MLLAVLAALTGVNGRSALSPPPGELPWWNDGSVPWTAGRRTKEMDAMTVSPAKESPILDTLREVVDGATAGKAFGTPVQHDGTLVLPVAKVGGGAGGGSGTGPAPEGRESGGTGGGLGLSAKPLGVYVLRNGKVSWRPAIDVNRIVLGGQIVAITGLLVLRAVLKARATTTACGTSRQRRRAAR